LQVRKAEQMHDLSGLIIPGGESTTMALVAERWNLVRALREAAQLV
jgi:5'-phosphate synthase pdxT subunit